MWPQLAALAAQRRTAAELRRLQSAQDAQALRNALAACAHNCFLGQIVGTLDGDSPAGAVTPVHLEAYADVVAAVTARDPETARSAMSALLQLPAGSRKRRPSS